MMRSSPTSTILLISLLGLAGCTSNDDSSPELTASADDQVCPSQVTQEAPIQLPEDLPSGPVPQSEAIVMCAYLGGSTAKGQALPLTSQRQLKPKQSEALVMALERVAASGRTLCDSSVRPADYYLLAVPSGSAWSWFGVETGCESATNGEITTNSPALVREVQQMEENG